MKNFIRNSILLLLILGTTSCGTTYYYVVRHAEKERQTDDTPLSEKGFRRAEDLAERLSGANIERVYVSDRLRTLQTAQPTVSRFAAECIIIPKEEVERLVSELRETSGKSVLVVWHSEELPLIVNSLSPADTIGTVGDEFNNLFIIKKEIFFGQQTIQLQRLTYGEPNDP